MCLPYDAQRNFICERCEYARLYGKDELKTAEEVQCQLCLHVNGLMIQLWQCDDNEESEREIGEERKKRAVDFRAFLRGGLIMPAAHGKK